MDSPSASAPRPPIISQKLGLSHPLRYPVSVEDLQEGGHAGPFRRMHLNESSHPPSPKVVAAIQQAVAEVNLYPDPKARAFTALLAAEYELPPSHFVVGNGSEYILQQLCLLTIESHKSAVLPDPSFPRYAMGVESMGGEAIRVGLRADGAMDVGRMLKAIRQDTVVLFAASPNNPTGAMLSGAELEELALGTPEDVLLVFDEAYYEFARHVGGPDALEALKKRTGPWVLTRTLSKAYGIAGLRLGYAICSSEELAEALKKVSVVFPLNNLALVAGMAAWNDRPYMNWLVMETSKERQRLEKGLRAMGFETLPSQANFIAARGPGPASVLVSALQKRGIIISSIRSTFEGYENYIRVSVGSASDTDALLTAIKEELKLT